MNKDREVSLPLELELRFRGVLGKATGRDYVGFGAGGAAMGRTSCCLC